MAAYRKITPQPTGPRLESADVQAFETRWGLKLPGDYKEWLLECNGGVPDSQVIHTLSGEVFVSSLFHLDPRGEAGLDSELRRLGGHEARVPVALEGGGGIVFISVASGELFMESSGCDGADDERQPVAASWSDFLDRFTPTNVEIRAEDELLDQIVRDADAAALDRLLAAGGCVDQQNSSGETLFQLAVLKRRTDSLELLLSRGASMQGALHTAARMGMIPMIEWLLQRGASLSERNAQGQRPEDVAAMPFVRRFLMNRREGGGQC